MIDIHSHILPGVDDGASDPDEAGQMLAMAAEDGTEAIIATPHADLNYQFDPVRCREELERLREQCAKTPRLHLGCEVHVTPENIANVIRNPQSFTLNGRDCLLLELPVSMLPATVQPAIEAIMDSGLRVIIAHPERYLYIQQELAHCDRLVDSGCYLQLTARSISGGFGQAAQSAANYILNRRLAHFVASDAHGATVRRPLLSAAFAQVTKYCGEAAALILFHENPAAILKGEAIRPLPAPSGWLNSLFSRAAISFRKQGASPHIR